MKSLSLNSNQKQLFRVSNNVYVYIVYAVKIHVKKVSPFLQTFTFSLSELFVFLAFIVFIFSLIFKLFKL